VSKKILFLTGKLAERQLSRILDSMKPEFNYKINQIGVSVAALMSENIIMRRVTKEKGYDKIIVPGKFRGDLKKLSNFFDIPVERGPDDLTNLPDYFGLEYQEQNLKDNDCMIFSEIVDATILSVDQILNRAFDLSEPNSTLHLLAHCVDVLIAFDSIFLSLVNFGHSSRTIRISELIVF